MKIYVDVTERLSVGKKILKKSNILRTEQLMMDRAHNRYVSTEEKIKIAQGYSIIQDLIKLYRTQNEYNNDVSKKRLLPKIKREIKKEKARIRDQHFPHYSKIKGVEEKDLNSYISQGDFVVINKQTTITEIKGTWHTLRDAIRDPREIEISLDRAKEANARYRLVVALPENSQGEDAEALWRENNNIFQDQYHHFMKKMRTNPRKVRMPKGIYGLSKDYFLDVDKHYKLLEEKQRRILDKVISLSP